MISINIPNATASANFQNWAFLNGYRWRSGGTVLLHLSSCILFLNEDYTMTYGCEVNQDSIQLPREFSLPWEITDDKIFIYGVEYTIKLEH